MLVNHNKLRKYAIEIIHKCGVPQISATTTGSMLVEANMRGIDSHGVILTDLYANRLLTDLINPTPAYDWDIPKEGVARLDADFSLGQPAALRAAGMAVNRAKECGIGAVAVKNANHFGIAAPYAEYIAEHDCIGLVMCNCESDVAVPGGKEKFLGTNPICCCIPSEQKPWFCMDMATSEVAFGKIDAALREKQKIPGNWAVDVSGEFTSDPHEAYAAVPFGGIKGYALGLMVEFFSSLLSGMPFSKDIVRKFDDFENKASIGFYIQAIDIDTFYPIADFKKRMEEFLIDLKSQPHNGEIYFPGELEYNTRCERLLKGCPISEADMKMLGNLGNQFGVSIWD